MYPHSSGPYEEMKLSVTSPMTAIVRAMAAPDSGLEIRDRLWLKITIPNACIGEFYSKPAYTEKSNSPAFTGRNRFLNILI